MKAFINKLLGTGPIERPVSSYNYKPYKITPEFQAWCKELNVSCLASRQSTNVEILMGNTVKIVDLQSICHL